MSSSILRIVALTLALSSPAAVGLAADPYMEDGTYACVTERQVGHQTSKQDNVRYSGSVTPAVDRFLITLAKIKQRPVQCVDPTKPYANVLKPGTHDWWWECASHQAVFSGGKVPGQKFRSDDIGGVFHEQFSPGVFWINKIGDAGSGLYRLFFTNSEGDFYLEEGTCQRMK